MATKGIVHLKLQFHPVTTHFLRHLTILEFHPMPIHSKVMAAMYANVKCKLVYKPSELAILARAPGQDVIVGILAKNMVLMELF